MEPAELQCWHFLHLRIYTFTLAMLVFEFEGFPVPVYRQQHIPIQQHAKERLGLSAGTATPATRPRISGRRWMDICCLEVYRCLQFCGDNIQKNKHMRLADMNVLV